MLTCRRGHCQLLTRSILLEHAPVLHSHSRYHGIRVRGPQNQRRISSSIRTSRFHARQRCRYGYLLQRCFSRKTSDLSPGPSKDGEDRGSSGISSRSVIQNAPQTGFDITQDNGAIELTRLRNAYEVQLDTAVSTRLGLNTSDATDSFRQYRSDFHTYMPAYVTRAVPRSDSVRLLWAAFDKFLPPDPLNDNITTPRGKLGFRQYADHDSDRRSYYPSNRMNLGWHMAMFPHPIDPASLLFDGTDARFLPGPADVWTHRVWLSGSIKLVAPYSLPLDASTGLYMHHMVEKPIKLRIQQPTAHNRPPHAYVTIRKAIHGFEGRLPAKYYTPSNLMKLFMENVKELPPKMNKSWLQPILVEDYTLLFFRGQQGTFSKPPRPLVNFTQPKFQHTFTPNRHLLFAWSAATQNAHLIHTDPTFAKEHYGAPKLVVHGPLTVFLTLQWFHRALTGYALDRLDRFTLSSINYSCIQPLFVDEPMTLCAKPVKYQKPGSLAPSWSVWIEKEVGDGNKALAFKAKIGLQVAEGTAPQAGQEETANLVEDGDIDENEPDDEGFKDPFFSSPVQE